MGYVVIDKSGRIASGEQVLSEEPGAAAENIDEILGALERVQQQLSGVSGGLGGR